MRNLLLTLGLAVLFQGCAAHGHLNCPQAAADSFTLVSDVDDTVKITNVPSRLAKVKNGLYGKLVFAGMPELYQGLLGENAYLEFVSGSPRLLRNRLTRRLDGAGFPRFQLALRGNPFRATRLFKLECLTSMHGKLPGQFLLIGDDTEMDPEVYEEFGAGREVRAVYIHRITGRDFDYAGKGMTPFTTAYEIAVSEYRAGHLALEQAAAVGEAVLASPDSAFLPAFQACPQEAAQSLDLPEPLAGLRERIDTRMNALCSNRRAPARGHRAAGRR